MTIWINNMNIHLYIHIPYIGANLLLSTAPLRQQGFVFGVKSTLPGCCVYASHKVWNFTLTQLLRSPKVNSSASFPAQESLSPPINIYLMESLLLQIVVMSLSSVSPAEKRNVLHARSDAQT